MEQIQIFCRKLKEKVSLSSTGHLHLSDRVKLMRQIKDPLLIGKIMFECAKKVYPIWQKDYPNDAIFIDMLHKCHEYLYQNKHNKEYLRSLADGNRNYAETEGDSSADAAISIICLCCCIAGDAKDILKDNPDCEYDKSDDDKYEADEWTTDFYASLAYSDGTPFTKNAGDILKRKDFWIWYVNTAMMLIEYPDNPVLQLPEIVIIKTINNDNLFKRIQTYNIPLIKERIDAIIAKQIELMNEKSVLWKKIILKSLNLEGGNLYEAYYISDNDTEEKFERIDGNNIQLFAQIKDAMYVQKPDEGAWLQSYLTVYPERKYEYEFNYDNRETLDYFANNPDELKSEFEAYPRSKEFTPEWWRNILGKKTKYLK
jgi:hypothetical protein